MSRLSYSFIVEHPQWIFLTVIGSAAAVGVSRYFIGQVVELTMHLTKLQNDIADASTAGILAGIAMYVVLMSARRRRILVLREMSRIADLNHHVRNSLQVIIGTELMKKEANAAVIESCERIQETIERLFPIVGVERRRGRPDA
jgi:multisubunit Na+/H+ antiporter MnhC subunit